MKIQDTTQPLDSSDSHTNGIQNMRKLGVERIYYRRPASHAIMSVKINGHVEYEKLREVLRAVQEKYPLLSSRIITNENHEAWFDHLDAREPLLERVHRQSDSHWQQVMAREHSFPFDREQGPLIRYVLLWTHEKSDLIINCHHSICDGLSLFYLIRDILLGLVGEEIGQTVRAPSLSKVVPSERRKIGFMRSQLFRMINKIWSRNDLRFSRDDFLNLHHVYWKNNNPIVTSFELRSEEVRGFASKCKEYGVTVHTAICAALSLARSQNRSKKKDTIKLHIPVDLRSRLKAEIGEAFGFYVSAIIVNLDNSDKQSFWDLAQVFHQQIGESLLDDKDLFKLMDIENIHPTLLDSTFFSKYNLLSNRLSSLVVKAMGIDRRVADISVTNLGRRELPDIGSELVIEAIYGPSVYAEIIESVVSVLTLNGIMYFTITYGESQMSREDVDEIVSRFYTIIKNNSI